jgi:hypothetical protein
MSQLIFPRCSRNFQNFGGFQFLSNVSINISQVLPELIVLRWLPIYFECLSRLSLSILKLLGNPLAPHLLLQYLIIYPFITGFLNIYSSKFRGNFFFKKISRNFHYTPIIYSFNIYVDLSFTPSISFSRSPFPLFIYSL